MTARPALRALAAGALAAGVFVACTLDWDVRPDPAPAQDGAPGVRDAPSADVEAAVNRDASPPVPDASECPALSADVVKTLAAARTCTFQVGECEATVKNECKCDVVIAQPDAQATTNYVGAVTALLKAGCSPACKPCGSTVGRACIAQGGPMAACYPAPAP